MDKTVLSKVVANDAAGVATYLSAAEGKDLVTHNPQLIEANTSVTDPNDSTKVLVRATQAGRDYLATNGNSNGKGASVSNHAIIKNVVLPEAKKRGNTSGIGAPSKYPFATMEVGDTFFSADIEHKKGDALKGLGSTVSANNDKYAEPTGEMKTVTRAVRDKETKKAQIGPDGKKMTETVQLPVKKYNRKFTIRAVVAGEKYGEWVAPANGALVGRTV